MVLCTGCQELDMGTRVRVAHCSIADGGKCLACKEDMELEHKIQELQERRRHLRTKINANHDPFVLRLPPELASHIFLLSIRSRDTLSRIRRRKFIPTPYLLGAVCQGWRQLARSTPELWSKLAFTISDISKSRTMEALPHLIADWLERLGGLPLTLQINYSRDSHLLAEGYIPIIDALNRHSERWCNVDFALPADYLGRLCGSSPSKNLHHLSISNLDDDYNPNDDPNDIPVTFKMNTRASPMKFRIIAIPLKAIEISGHNLVDLHVQRTRLDGVLEIMRDAPLLEVCFLFIIFPPVDDFPIPKTMIRLSHLRKLRVYWIDEIEVFNKLINSLELPSLELWVIQCSTNMVNAAVIVPFLKRSACNLKELRIEWEVEEPGVEDFGRVLQAIPYLQKLRVSSTLLDWSLAPVMDNILERIAASPPHPMLQTGNTAGFLSGLQSLQFFSRKFNVYRSSFDGPQEASELGHRDKSGRNQ